MGLSHRRGACRPRRRTERRRRAAPPEASPPASRSLASISRATDAGRESVKEALRPAPTAADRRHREPGQRLVEDEGLIGGRGAVLVVRGLHVPVPGSLGVEPGEAEVVGARLAAARVDRMARAVRRDHDGGDGGRMGDPVGELHPGGGVALPDQGGHGRQARRRPRTERVAPPSPAPAFEPCAGRVSGCPSNAASTNRPYWRPAAVTAPRLAIVRASS